MDRDKHLQGKKQAAVHRLLEEGGVHVGADTILGEQVHILFLGMVDGGTSGSSFLASSSALLPPVGSRLAGHRPCHVIHVSPAQRHACNLASFPHAQKSGTHSQSLSLSLRTDATQPLISGQTSQIWTLQFPSTLPICTDGFFSVCDTHKTQVLCNFIPFPHPSIHPQALLCSCK